MGRPRLVRPGLAGPGHPRSVNPRKFQEALFRGNRDANLDFESMRRYLMALGFTERVRGSHHVFARHGLERPFNLQESDGRCKLFQVRQIRKVLARLNLRLHHG